MIGILQVIQGPDLGKRFSVGKQRTTIGRGPTNGIVLTDPKVSRAHCAVTWEGERVLVADAGSGGGTWVNGERLTAARELQPGDLLAVGGTHLEFKWSREDEKSTTSLDPPARKAD
jgi:pSer/pThr/pTyr-binding forkhead associated (FHA) protein